MEENFEPVARTRANYYTPGSPVQFVCVELLKGEVSGEHAVCLTFKNISRVTLTALEKVGFHRRIFLRQMIFQSQASDFSFCAK